MLVAERYRMGEALGRGGMGEVYRATDEVLGREVAIKLLLPASESLAGVERFQREARAAAMLSDPHVVATYDFGSHGDGYYLAMELVEGRTVSAELKTKGLLEPEWAVQIVRQAAAGLAAAHRHGLVHRDIKPGNLLLTDDGLVKVADFGIVRILGDTTALTATGQIVGTSHYLAPERVLGEAAEAASDVYALGCVLYQLVTGHPPFTADDPASVMYQHVQTRPTPPSELRPQLAGEVEALLLWLLAKDPADRPTAEQVAAGATPPLVARTETLPAPPVRRRPSRKVLSGAAAVLTIALISAIGILLDADSPRLPAPRLPATSEIRPPAVAASGTPTPIPPPAPERTQTVGRKVTAGTESSKPPQVSSRTTSTGASAKNTAKVKKPTKPNPGKHKANNGGKG